jgi:4'-phosphopantetheinyl transferase
MAPGWVTASAADVPGDDAWLGAAERRVLAGLQVEKRRADWRLGRWTAKRAVAATCPITAERVEILAAADGAPQAWLDGARLPLSLSLSHRAGRGLAVVAADPSAVGCDLELVEPRSPAFVRDWLADSERALLAARGGIEHARLANLLWAAKEAAAKVRREGLRLDVRRARVRLDTASPAAGDGWSPLRVDWPDAQPTRGWWRAEPGWVIVIAGEPAPEPPRRL